MKLGQVKRVNDSEYTIRFTPRKPSSIWSAVNIAKFARLNKEGRMWPAGEQAFANRTEAKSVIYAYEQATTAKRAERRDIRLGKLIEACAKVEL